MSHPPRLKSADAATSACWSLRPATTTWWPWLVMGRAYKNTGPGFESRARALTGLNSLLNKKLRFWGPFSKVGIGPSLVLGPSTKVGLWAFKKTWRPKPGLDPDPSLALTHLVLVLGPPSVLMLGWSLLDTISPYPKIVMDDCPYWGSFVCEYDLRATCSSSLMMKKNSLCILQVVYLLPLSFISTIYCKNFPRFWGCLQMDISSRVLWYICIM